VPELSGPEQAPPQAVDPLPTDLEAYLDSVERSILEQALVRHRFNRTAAGASLGLSLRQMRYRMARLGIGLETDTSEAGAGQ
jgi:two-component system response regulator PilR (NtrC family)